MNFQIYWNDSKPVPLHFDGEYFDFELTGNRIFVKSGLRPSIVGIYILFNHTHGGGTSIYDNTHTLFSTINSLNYDLLLLNTTDFMHGVFSLKAAEQSSNRPIRFIVGYRSIEYMCKVVTNNNVTEHPIDIKHAKEITKHFLTNIWPDRFKKQKIAF